jgi:hypothetical protein
LPETKKIFSSLTTAAYSLNQPADQVKLLVVADEYELEELRKIGVRKLMRATKLTQKAIYSILSGKGVRQQTMHVFRTALASLGIQLP